MKFERGRKKNQLIWSFILKVIAGQSLVKTMFLNKTRKENVSRGIRFRSRGDVLGTYAPSLKTEKMARGSLTVGPEGPLVRFDRSPLPPLSLCPNGGGLRRSPSTNSGSSRAPEGGDGMARLGRSSWWSLGRRRWKESPAASSAAICSSPPPRSPPSSSSSTCSALAPRHLPRPLLLLLLRCRREPRRSPRLRLRRRRRRSPRACSWSRSSRRGRPKAALWR